VYDKEFKEGIVRPVIYMEKVTLNVPMIKDNTEDDDEEEEDYEDDTDEDDLTDNDPEPTEEDYETK